MNKNLAHAILRSLSFSGDAAASMRSLSGFDTQDWQGTFRWLDNANLALYLLRRLEHENTTHFLPPSVLSRLQRNFATNRIRVASMADEFRTINAAFTGADLVCPVIKGFSLVPHSCPDAYLRQPSDLDYLVAEKDQPAAEAALFRLGYSLKSHIAREWKYYKGSLNVPSNPEGQYDSETPFVVELHLDVWDDCEQNVSIPSLAARGFQTKRNEWEGSTFTALSEEDSFLLQVVHTTRHVLDGWAKLSWFYEIGYFLSSTHKDDALWQRVERQSAGSTTLRGFVAVITQLSNQFFDAPIPRIVNEWATHLSKPAQLWVERYGQHILFAKVPVYEISLFPTAPCALFLQQEFIPNRQLARRAVRDRLFPRAVRTRAALRSVRQQPTMILSAQWRRQQKMFRKAVYFVGSMFRYLWELPRWHWLNAIAKFRVTAAQRSVQL